MTDTACTRCGAFGNLPHGWIEGDCILPHKNHSRHLLAGTHICEPCIERHAEWLSEIPDMYATLPNVVLTGSIADDTAEHKRPKKQPASPSPLRLDAWAMLHPEYLNAWIKDETTGQLRHTGTHGLPDVPAVLAAWAQACYDTLGWNDTAPTTVSGACAVLSSHTQHMASLPDIDTYDAELRWLRRALRAACGISDPEPLFACLTLDCGGNVWRMTAGSPACDRCRRRYAALDYVRAKGDTLTNRQRLRAKRDGTGRA